MDIKKSFEVRVCNLLFHSAHSDMLSYMTKQEAFEKIFYNSKCLLNKPDIILSSTLVGVL
jgi:hypothetical protein